MRTPLLPLAEFLTWGNRRGEALHADRDALRAQLRALAGKPEIRDAIFVASPDLDDYIDQWLREPESKRGQRVEGALVRYFTRMCSRSTPFGLFASTALGRISEKTELIVSGRQSCNRRTRLDMDYLFALVAALVKDPDVHRELRYRPNNSLYFTSADVRYVESRLRGNSRSYHLTAVEKTEYLISTLERAAAGAKISELAGPLVSEDISQADAEAFIERLIESQILSPDFAPPVTGDEPFEYLIARLSEVSCSDRARNVLIGTRDELSRIDAAELGVEPARYRAVAEKLKELPADVDLKRLFQVDLSRPANIASLGEAVINEIRAGAELLRQLFARPHESELDQFRLAFLDRYERREVPLAEALDDDLGIGFPVGDRGGNAPLIAGLALGKAGEAASSWRRSDQYLFEKLVKIWEDGSHELTLTDQDIAILKQNEPLDWTNSFSVICKVASGSPEALARGEFQVLIDAAGGSSGANSFGRFCHADEDLKDAVIGCLRAEAAQDSEAIVAEIAHMPEGRIGNILARPVMRDYEIPYLGVSGADPERQLPLDDLLISVRDQRVVIRSARFGREVTPRLTTAHNWRAERAGVYRFLCALQTQGRAPGVSWNWGALAHAPFLPRVCYGRQVLSPARWFAARDELKPITEAPLESRFQKVQEWRAVRRLPRFIALADDDNTLPIDLDNALSVDSFVHLIKNHSSIELCELWPSPDELCAVGEDGAFAHELIVPFLRQPQSPHARRVISESPAPSQRFAVPAVRRKFAPGSEWLYIKIYSGKATADRVLRRVFAPVLDGVIASGAIDRWFFLRYADPDPHLRARFHGRPESLRDEVFPALQSALAPMLEDGRVRRLQIDTYEREIERYGGDHGMLLSEQIFHLDSASVLEMMNRLDSSDGELDQRWRLALSCMDRTLEDLGFDSFAKLEIVKNLRARFLAEFKASEQTIRQLGDRYRKERKSLEALLSRAINPESPMAEALNAWSLHSATWRRLGAEFRAAESNGLLSESFSNIVSSCLHLHANRMLRSSQRAQEMVIYDLLTRLYSAQLARGEAAESSFSKEVPRGFEHRLARPLGTHAS